MRRKAWFYGSESRERGRVLARVLSEDLRRVRGGEEVPLDSDIVTAAPPGRDISSPQADGEMTF
jgi:hypothetical protein